MELNNWIDEYVNDKRTQEIFGKWAEEIAEDKGVKKGRKLGIEQRNYEIAKNLIKLNTPIKNIHLATGLSIEEIKALKN